MDKTTNITYAGTQNVSLSGATANVCLFALNPTNIHRGMRVHSLKVWKNNVLTLDLVPVKRSSDSVVCLYDKVSGNYLTNAGTGSFIAGPEVSQESRAERKVEDL